MSSPVRRSLETPAAAGLEAGCTKEPKDGSNKPFIFNGLTSKIWTVARPE
jgi:hypothetical protein